MVTVTRKRILVQASSDRPKTVHHVAGDTLFYGGPQVSIAEADGALEAGDVMTVEFAMWFVSDGHANLAEQPAPGGLQLIAERLAALEGK